MKKKIVSAALAFIVTFGVFACVPADLRTDNGFSITASAADGITKTSDGFIIAEYNGEKTLTGYEGTRSDITIPAGIDHIYDSAFYGNSKITSITFAGDIKTVGVRSFQFCTNLKKVTFNGNLTYNICNFAFSGCTSLKEVVFKGNVGKYDAASGDCWGITDYAFLNCVKLESVVFENRSATLGSVGGGAFMCCFALNKIELPDDTGFIYPWAFINCFALENVTIPDNTAYIGDNAFGYTCPTDEKLYLNGEAKGLTVEYVDYKNGKSQREKMTVPSNVKDITLTVKKDSSGEEYAKKYNVKYQYSDASLNEEETPAAPEAPAETETTAETPAVTETPAPAKKLSAPAGLKATNKSKNKIGLTWSAVDGADGYNVYMYDSAAKEYKLYKKVKTCKVTVGSLKAGTKYKFKVCAVSKNGKKYTEGKFSKVLTVSTKK